MVVVSALNVVNMELGSGAVCAALDASVTVSFQDVGPNLGVPVGWKFFLPRTLIRPRHTGKNTTYSGEHVFTPQHVMIDSLMSSIWSRDSFSGSRIAGPAFFGILGTVFHHKQTKGCRWALSVKQ